MSDRPLLTVVHGRPAVAELATVTLLLTRRPPPAPAAPAGWADPAARLRQPLRPGPGAWSASGRAPGVRTRAGW